MAFNTPGARFACHFRRRPWYVVDLPLEKFEPKRLGPVRYLSQARLRNFGTNASIRPPSNLQLSEKVLGRESRCSEISKRILDKHRCGLVQWG